MLDNKKKPSTLRWALKNSATKLKTNDDGIAAIEFALLAPLLIGIYFGIAEITTAIAVDNRVAQAAFVAGDIISQYSEVTQEEIEDLLTAVVRVANVPKPEKLAMQIHSYMRTSSGTAYWGAIRLQFRASPMPSSASPTDFYYLAPPDKGIILVNIGYTYTPMKLKYLNTDINLKDQLAFKPRNSDLLDLKDNHRRHYDCVVNDDKTVSCEKK